MAQGWTESTGHTDHAELQKYVASLSPEALDNVSKDCRAALQAMPNSKKANHYADTICYIADRKNELRRAS